MTIKKILLMMAILAIGVLIGHNVNIYAGQNKGVTWGDCGIEVIGHFGAFCNVD